MRFASALVVAGLFASGCTVANPEYASDGGGIGPKDMARHPPIDLAVTTPPDLDVPPQCVPDQRSCELGSTTSAMCINGVFVSDRVCPIESVCLDGYCQVPPGNGTTQGDGCNSENQCLFARSIEYSCQPFIDQGSGQEVFRCAHVFGQGGSGAPCASGNQCRSGYCIASTGTCFRLCNGSDFDCPVHNGIKTVCRDVMIRVEGVDVKATSCVNP